MVGSAGVGAGSWGSGSAGGRDGGGFSSGGGGSRSGAGWSSGGGGCVTVDKRQGDTFGWGVGGVVHEPVFFLGVAIWVVGVLTSVEGVAGTVDEQGIVVVESEFGVWTDDGKTGEALVDSKVLGEARVGGIDGLHVAVVGQGGSRGGAEEEVVDTCTFVEGGEGVAVDLRVARFNVQVNVFGCGDCGGGRDGKNVFEKHCMWVSV